MSKLIYEKGKPMREEGFIPSAKENIKNAIHSILSFPGKIMDGVEGRMKKQDEYIKNRDDKMKTENWGSPENYDKLQQKGAMKKLIKAPKLDKVEPLKMKKLIPLKEMNKKPVGKI